LADWPAPGSRQFGDLKPGGNTEFTLSSALPPLNDPLFSGVNAMSGRVVSSPVVFAAPADVELLPAPIPADWIIDGNPQARSKRLAASADGTTTAMAWSCTPGRFNWHYRVDETIHFISGEVFVTDEKNQTHRLGPGDMVFFPAGSHSVWHVTKEVRKFAICRHSMPRPLGFALRAWHKVIAILSGSSGGELDSKPAVVGHTERATAA
jgi:uncharacterized protein